MARSFFQSFRWAGRGLRHVFRSERNFRVQALGAGAVIAAMVAGGLAKTAPLRPWEDVVFLLLIMMVLTMELLNTALEYFTDLLKPRLHNYVSVIKDIMAGAVLLTSAGALVIGIIIFLPHFIAWVK